MYVMWRLKSNYTNLKSIYWNWAHPDNENQSDDRTETIFSKTTKNLKMFVVMLMQHNITYQ